MTTGSEYRSLLDLPELAGLCTMEQACRTGWSVEESVSRLKHLHYLLKRLSEIFTKRIPCEPIYELKSAYSLHAYLCAEQVTLLRKRVGEMREPPLGLEHVPHAALKLALDELEFCPNTRDFVTVAYSVIIPHALARCNEFMEQAHPLADAPTVRIAKLIDFELTPLQEFGLRASQCLAQATPQTTNSQPEDSDASLPAKWQELVRRCLTLATEGHEHCELPSPIYSGDPPPYDATPKRDERFSDPYNAGVNPEAFLYDEAFSARDKTLMMYYKRLREIDVPEMMASILVDLRDEEPWEFYAEMVRQLWDEARHAMMGEVGFVRQGIDWTQIPINFTWSLNMNTQLDARQRHGVLFFIEQGLMPKTGKRYEWEIATQSGDELSAVFQDFDWADEVLHAQIGRRWYVPKFDSLTDALAYGDRCWSQVLSHWHKYQEDGLTQHRNWWPDLYRSACEKWGIEPSADALAFNTSYEDQRADLQDL